MSLVTAHKKDGPCGRQEFPINRTEPKAGTEDPQDTVEDNVNVQVNKRKQKLVCRKDF